MIGLLYWLVIGLGIVAMVAGLVALFFKKWKLAVGLVVPALAAVLLVVWWMDASDPYVRIHVDPREIVGRYGPENESAVPWLRAMGYEDITGQITFAADGTFVAHDLPACCLHGLDETQVPFSGGYYTASGTWRLDETESFTALILDVSKATLSRQPRATQGVRFADPRDIRSPLKLSLWKAKPLEIAFELWGSGDPLDLRYTRQHAAASN
jgi:hypothetical protein